MIPRGPKRDAVATALQPPAAPDRAGAGGQLPEFAESVFRRTFGQCQHAVECRARLEVCRRRRQVPLRGVEDPVRIEAAVNVDVRVDQNPPGRAGLVSHGLSGGGELHGARPGAVLARAVHLLLQIGNRGSQAVEEVHSRLVTQDMVGFGDTRIRVRDVARPGRLEARLDAGVHQ